MVNSNTPDKADFCIEVSFQKESENPSRVFRSTYELIETCQFIDNSLVNVVDSNIEPILLLEDVESGSIKVWLKSLLKAIPDDSLYNIDWKPIIGQYLVRAKYYIIHFLEGKTQITNIIYHLKVPFYDITTKLNGITHEYA